jgi:transcriptional regulator with XRE-family HTH domain
MKYAPKTIKPPPVTPQSTPPDNPALHHDGVVFERPSFLAHISKAIGRKELCFELRISKSLLDQWMSGEKQDPIERTRKIMQIAMKYYGVDLALAIVQELARDLGAVAINAEQMKTIRQIAALQ